MKPKVIRFHTATRNRYKKQISSLKRHSPASAESKIYIGLLKNDQLIAGVFMDPECEIYNYVRPDYRNRGHMKNLLSRVIKDVDSGKILCITANVINNEASEHVVKTCGMRWDKADRRYIYKYADTHLPMLKVRITTDGGPWCVHNMPCACCTDHKAVYRLDKGMFLPCPMCQDKYVLTKKRTGLLGWIQNIFFGPDNV